MSSCVAYACTNTFSKKIPGITFHRFPKDEKQRSEWIKAVRRENWNPTLASRLCSAHFCESMIDRTSLVRVRLRENAVPTIFQGISILSAEGDEIICHFREAECGTVHLYQTTAVPMYIYMFLHNGYWLNLKEKLFPIKHQRLFTCHKLQSHTAYIVKPGLKYLIYTTRKTFFSCHVLSGEMKLPYETVDVLQDIKDKRKNEKEQPTVDLYEKPPATPHMLDVKKIQQAKSLTQFKRNPFDKFRMLKPPKKFRKVYMDLSDPETDSEQTHPEPEQTHHEQQQTHPEPEQTIPELQPIILEPEISPLLEIRQQWTYEYPL